MKNNKIIKQKLLRNSDARDAAQKLYNHSAPILIAEAIFFAVVGIMLILRPVGLLTVITFIFGVVLMLFGLYRTAVGFAMSRNYGGGWCDVLFGMINVMIGVLFCVYPIGSIVSLVYVFVILFLVKALRALGLAINMVRFRFGRYRLNLLMALVLLIVAMLLLLRPMAGAVAVVLYVAIMLLMYAAFDVYMFFELRRLKNRIF